MNPPKIKTIVLIIGILPTLLTSIAQIGYLSFRQNSEYAPLLQPAEPTLNTENDRRLLAEQAHSFRLEYRSLIIAGSLIGLSGILLASFIAIYFGRRLSKSLGNNDSAKTEHAGSVSPSKTSTETQASADKPTPLNSPSFSVLIADDNNINRLLLKNQLEGRCQKITVANEGVEALKYVTKERFDLVLLDLQMPGHSGHELIKMIRQDHCINRETPVIAITAHAQLSQRKKIIAEGFDECLIKPILAEQLDEIIDLWKSPANPLPQTVSQDYPRQILNKTCQNYDLALTIAKKLFVELPQQLKHIETALKHQQPGLALEITHKLHGSVSFCGLTDIQKPANSLEQNLLNNDYREATASFRTLQDVIRKFTKSENAILAVLSKRNSQNDP